MFLLFKHKRNQKQDIGNSVQDRIANSIGLKYIKVQVQCATFLQQKSERLSGKVKKLLLVMFLLLSCGYSLYLIIESFLIDKNKSFSITAIRFLKQTRNAVDENTQASEIFSEAEYERITRFRVHMDSLAKSATGKMLYDSILNKRPGLMDSIRVIHEMYKAKN
jgi:hypothetical protein